MRSRLLASQIIEAVRDALPPTPEPEVAGGYPPLRHQVTKVSLETEVAGPAPGPCWAPEDYVVLAPTSIWRRFWFRVRGWPPKGLPLIVQATADGVAAWLAGHPLIVEASAEPPDCQGESR